MRRSSMNMWTLAALLVLGLTTGCPSEPGGGNSGTDGGASTMGDNGGASDLEGKVEIDGSSTVAPISQAVAVDFMKEYPKVKVTVGISGTGGGFKRFTKGETDVSDASRPIKDSEFKLCQEAQVDFIELPVAYDGLSVVINPKNEFVKKLTIDDLKKIFLAPGAKVWKEVNAAWPDETIKIYAPGKDSGTYDYFFSDVVNRDGKGQPRDEGVSFNEDDNALVDGVAREEFAIGFFGCSYYFENTGKLTAVPIVDPKTGEAVSPTSETIESGEYAPFSRPLFIYLNAKSLDSPAMKQFTEYYLSNAGKLSAGVGYVALPDDIYERAYSHYENKLTGTHYLTPEMEKRSGALTDVYVEENLLKVTD